jgi:hypothetical protein
MVSNKLCVLSCSHAATLPETQDSFLSTKAKDSWGVNFIFPSELKGWMRLARSNFELKGFALNVNCADLILLHFFSVYSFLP